MKIKAIFAAIAVAAVALLAASCSKTDTGANAGGYYMRPYSGDATGVDATLQLKWNGALRDAFPGITYKTAENDKKAIAACDKVLTDNPELKPTITFELQFQTAVADGEKPTITTVKQYKPAN